MLEAPCINHLTYLLTIGQIRNRCTGFIAMTTAANVKCQRVLVLVHVPGYFWATVCKAVRPMLSDRCLSRLSVTWCIVAKRQTVGWIKMKLGMQVGLGPGHIVLDRDPAPPYRNGHSPQFWAHICCGQMAGWIKMPLGRKVRSPRPKRYRVRWGPSSFPPKEAQPHNFRPMTIVAKRLDGSRCHLVWK